MANPPANWNGANRSATPLAAYGQGYDVVTTAIQANENGVNAWLTDSADSTHVKLTVISVEMNLALAGSTGQSVLNRDYYPRNFQQPSFIIGCQARSQQEVGRVAEFVHKAQRSSITSGSLMGLTIPQAGLRKTSSSMRGKGKGISAAGYVRNMPRVHRRHDPAPQFTFEFVVSRMRAGVFQDQPYKVYKLAKWSEIVDNVLSGNVVEPPKTIEQEQQEEAARKALEAIDFIGDLLGFD